MGTSRQRSLLSAVSGSGTHLRDSLNTDEALTTSLHTGARAMVLSPAAGHGDRMGHASGALGTCGARGRSDGCSGGSRGEAPCSQITAPLRLQAPQPKGSSDSSKGEPFLWGEVQNIICFHVTSAWVSTTLEPFLPCCAMCRRAGAHLAAPAGHGDAAPRCWSRARSLLGLPWDEAPGGLATSRCCLMLRASFLSRNSPNKYITVKVTHGSRRHCSRF